MEKNRSDDELIEALRGEVERLKTILKEQKALKNQEILAEAKRTSSSIDHDENTARREISRLEKLCKSQLQQLATQDSIIRELRGQLI